MSPGLELAGGEENQLDAGLDGGIQKHLVVGIMLGIPEHHLVTFERSRACCGKRPNRATSR